MTKEKGIPVDFGVLKEMTKTITIDKKQPPKVMGHLRMKFNH